MPVLNSDVAGIFNRVADLLEIRSANAFRIRAYRNAARTVAGLPKRVSDMVEDGEPLDELSGIGKDLAGKIREIVETGTLSQLRALERNGSSCPLALVVDGRDTVPRSGEKR